MHAQRILIVYASSYGQTEKIAARVASYLRALGHRVELQPVDSMAPYRWVGEYDAVVVGGSVYAGRHQRRLEEFVQRHLGELAQVPTAFFSVSASAGRHDPEAGERADAQLRDFLNRTGWNPDATAAIAGAFPYTRYGFLLRSMMKLLNRGQGFPTDTSVDLELTDWEQVEDFAETIADLLFEQAEAAAAADHDRTPLAASRLQAAVSPSAPRRPPHPARASGLR